MSRRQKMVWLYVIIFAVHGNLGGLTQTSTSSKKTANLTSRSFKEKPRTIIVKAALKKFTLNYSTNHVAIKGYMLDLSLRRKRCNAHILDRFNQDIKNIKSTHKKALKKIWEGKKAIDTLEVQLGSKKYFVNGRSKAGLVFMALPREITRMKWEEKLNCEKGLLK